MRPETKYFTARKFLEGLVFSALVFVVFLHFVTWPAYFVLGGLVAVALAYSELRSIFKDGGSKAFFGFLYLFVAALNVLFWPAMIINNVTRQRG